MSQSPKGAVNIGHSPLLQTPTQPQTDLARPSDLLDARRKFSSFLESNVLDYLHHGPQALEECIQHLYTLFSNIVNNPNEPKYRRVKAANKAFLRYVASIGHTEELMLQAGWRSKVVEMEKSWVWEHETSSHEFRVLVEVTEVLQKALATLHMKAERKRKEEEERKSKQSGERERIRLALEDDRRQRQLAQELTAARPHPPAAADPPAAAADPPAHH